MKSCVFVGALLIFAGCITTNSQYSSNAEIVMSPNFNLSMHKRIAILPFKNVGQDGYDPSISDKLSMYLMEMGFTVIERSQLEALFSEMKMELSGAIRQSELSKIGRLLNINAIVFGTATYRWIPGRAFVNQYGGASKAGYYSLNSESLRFVDVATGEVLISAYCDNSNGSISKEIVLAIKNKLSAAGSDWQAAPKH